MKTSIIISLFCLSALGGYAQTQDNDDQATERQQIHDRALEIYCKTNGNMGPGAEMHYKTNYSNVHAAYPNAPQDAAPAKPSGDVAYTELQNPPCYTYTDRDGNKMMTCPGANFNPGTCENPQAALTEIQTNNGNFGVSGENTYTGHYSDLHSVYPQAPPNAVPAWPSSSDYTQLQDPPCYEYINERGLKVTECPGAQFEPEHVYR